MHLLRSCSCARDRSRAYRTGVLFAGTPEQADAALIAAHHLVFHVDGDLDPDTLADAADGRYPDWYQPTA